MRPKRIEAYSSHEDRAKDYAWRLLLSDDPYDVVVTEFAGYGWHVECSVLGDEAESLVRGIADKTGVELVNVFPSDFSCTPTLA